MPPEVSYLVVCFNSEKYVEKCISSILGQTHTDSEIIIIDNKSEDTTVSILKELSKNNNKISLILNQANLGYGVALNEAIRTVKGEFIAILNADVFLDKDWARNLLRAFRIDSKIMACSGRIFFPNGELFGSGGMMDKYGAVIQREGKISNMRNTKDDVFFYLDGSAFVVRKKIFEEISFDPKLFLYYEDVDFSWKIRMLGYQIAYVKDAISYHDVGHSYPDMSPSKFYHLAKNRIYLCQKNYSKKNSFYRIPLIISLIFINAIFYELSRKPKGYINKFVRALLWNLINLRSTLDEHRKVQSTRKIMDEQIDKYLLKKSIEFTFLNRFS